VYCVQACVETCLDRTIAKQCGCYRDDYLFYFNQTDIDTLPSCYSNKTSAFYVSQKFILHKICSSLSPVDGKCFAVYCVVLICAYNLRSQQENGNSTNCDCTQSCQ
jgi:hypothetical protein